jgi:hypothetical protein
MIDLQLDDEQLDDEPHEMEDVDLEDVDLAWNSLAQQFVEWRWRHFRPENQVKVFFSSCNATSYICLLVKLSLCCKTDFYWKE